LKLKRKINVIINVHYMMYINDGNLFTAILSCVNCWN